MALAERTLDSGTDTASTNGATTLSVSPTGMVEDDWLEFAVCSAGGTGAHTNTAGDCVRVHDDQAGGTTIVTSTWKKKCGASEAGPYTFSFGGSTRRATINVTCWSGGDPTDIVESAPAQVTANNATSIDAPGVDPAATGGVHIVHVFSRTAGGTAQTFDAVTNYTQENTESSTHATNANANGSAYSRALPNADATGDITCTVQVQDRLNAASLLLKPASGVSGDIDVTLPALTAEADGVVEVAGVVATTLPALTVEADGVVEVAGVVAVTLPALAVDADGVVTVEGPIAVTLPTLTAEVDGVVEVAGSLAVTLPALVADADGSVAGGAVSGALVTTLPALTADADGTLRVDGTVVVALPALTADADGIVRVEGATGATLPAMMIALTGTLPARATSVASVGAVAGSAPTVTATTHTSVSSVAAPATSSPTVGG